MNKGCGLKEIKRLKDFIEKTPPPVSVVLFQLPLSFILLLRVV